MINSKKQKLDKYYKYIQDLIDKKINFSFSEYSSMINYLQFLFISNKDEKTHNYISYVIEHIKTYNFHDQYIILYLRKMKLQKINNNNDSKN